ncbi:acetamidase/formamidase family protein [Bradyrhizobium sp.]|uniref:acetamidase/formamidase family protein n=1 Tax=Bradyrhizobium sp. TaxID=376 RepID=UPI002629C974|nr:acetamidase/formamidase family protein [Bradyrhizobium sp.]
MSIRVKIDSVPSAMRPRIWQNELASLGLRAIVDRAGDADGAIALCSSLSGTQLAHVSGRLESLAAEIGTIENRFIALSVVGGGGHLIDREGDRAISSTEMLVLTLDPNWRIEWESDVDVILFSIPRSRIEARLGRSRLECPFLLGDTPIVDALRAMFQSFAMRIDEIDQVQLTVGEGALLDLIVSAMLSVSKAGSGPMTGVQAAHFRRIAAAIESRLSDPTLCVADIAKQERLSTRYIQRLFERRNQSFSDYVRHSRLERSRADLIDSNHADESIAEIARRWGFPDQAHFSRSFNRAFGTTPKAVRHQFKNPFSHQIHRGTLPKRLSRVESKAQGEATETAERQVRPCDIEAVEHAYLPANAETVHWGYLSEAIPPVLYISPGARVTVETLTQHAGDDAERMIQGDPGAESVFAWTQDFKAINRRGAGPLEATVFGRGAGEGFGVHICTGPIFVAGAEPGDFLEVEILDVRPRPCKNPAYAGKAFASNVSAWWGYQYQDLLDRVGKHETITIYEIDLAQPSHARPLYSYEWTPQTDPFGVRHETIDYPGIVVDAKTVRPVRDVLRGVRIPARPSFGFMAVAPREQDPVDSIPPSQFGGNLDNWRAGRGARVYLPVAVSGALLSLGDGHFAQGDGEVNGTGLECSLTGDICIRLHKAGSGMPTFLRGLHAPLIETETHWIVQAFSYQNYLRELGKYAQSEVYKRSTIDLALRNAFRQTRRFLMDAFDLAEDEALSVMSLASDFGVTQVADGNLGVHASIPKALFSERGAAIGNR